MSDMFKNYTEENLSGKYKITNEKQYLNLEKEYWGEINLYTSNSYSYILDLKNKNYKKDDIESVHIIYVQGTKTLISKLIEEKNIHEYNIGVIKTQHYIKVDWDISVAESLLFNSYNKSVFAQIKTSYKDGNIIYSPFLKHAIRANLNEFTEETEI